MSEEHAGEIIEITRRPLPGDQLYPIWCEARLKDDWHKGCFASGEGLPVLAEAETEVVRFHRVDLRPPNPHVGAETTTRHYYVKLDERGIFDDLIRVSQRTVDAFVMRARIGALTQAMAYMQQHGDDNLLHNLELLKECVLATEATPVDHLEHRLGEEFIAFLGTLNDGELVNLLGQAGSFHDWPTCEAIRAEINRRHREP